jgi:hypothetical protein
MNYKKIHDSLIERAKNRIIEGYTETHHIIPRCLGGTDDISNLVELTPEEHYLVHQLLIRVYPDNPKLIKAAVMMIPMRPSNKLYGWLKKRYSLVKSQEQSGPGNSQFGTKWITNGIIEKKISKEDTLPEGWLEKRLSSFLKNKKKLEQKKITNDEKISCLKSLHNIYCAEGFEGVKKTGYKYTKANLVSQFAKYLPDFVPQNGKKRSIRS